jgi:hypothetical protein
MLICKMEQISFKIIMMKFPQKLVTIKGLVISNLVMLITMKRNISITIIIIKMSTSKIHKKEASKNMR